MEDHFFPRVDVRHRISAVDDNCGGGGGEGVVLDEVCGRSRVRDSGIRLGIWFDGAGKGVFRGGK